MKRVAPTLLLCIVPVLAFGVHAEDAPAALSAAAKAAVEAKLKDPSSAQYRHVTETTTDGGIHVTCGEINAKNSYGGFAGFSRFAVLDDTAFIRDASKPAQAKAFDDVAAHFCP